MLYFQFRSDFLTAKVFGVWCHTRSQTRSRFDIAGGFTAPLVYAALSGLGGVIFLTAENAEESAEVAARLEDGIAFGAVRILVLYPRPVCICSAFRAWSSGEDFLTAEGTEESAEVAERLEDGIAFGVILVLKFVFVLIPRGASPPR